MRSGSGMLTRVLFALVLISGLAGFALLGPQALAGDDSPSGQAETKVLALGVTDHEVAQEELESGAALPVPHFNTPAMAYVLAANVKKGDVVEIALVNGDKSLLHNTQELVEDQAKLLLQAGKRGVPAGGWPEGTYHAELKIIRDGKPVISESSKPMVFD